MLSRFKHFKLGVMVMAIATVLVALVSPVISVSAQDNEPIRIGIVQYVEHEALDAAREGFVDQLTNSEYGDRIEFDVQNASGNQATLQSISEKVARDNDILYAIATPAAQVLATVEQEKPVFFAAVTDPVEAGLVESLEEPGRNVTGTSDMAPIEEQVDLLIRNFPETQTVGLIYNSSEVNSQVQAEQAIEILEEQGLQTEVATVVSTNDISQAMNSLVEDVDAMFMVTDNTIDSAITLVGDIAKENNIPTIGSSAEVVRMNGLATLSNSYEDYGRQTADMVIRMLDEGLEPSQIPVELGQNFELIVNEEFAEAIGVDPTSIQ